MELRYASKELERQCTEDSYAQRKRNANVAKALKMRLTELRVVQEMEDLLSVPGRWEELKGGRVGQWSARLNKNWRLIVEPEGETVTVLIVEITDYH